jgi:hypothetical protein
MSLLRLQQQQDQGLGNDGAEAWKGVSNAQKDAMRNWIGKRRRCRE